MMIYVFADNYAILKTTLQNKQLKLIKKRITNFKMKIDF